MDASTQREVPANFTRELGRAVTFLHRSRARFMNERLRDLGFSGAMYLILLHIERHPGATQDSIANHMFIDKCNVARRTKKLETLGYLYRETDQNDRRQNNLYGDPQIYEPVGQGSFRQPLRPGVRHADCPAHQNDRPERTASQGAVK